MKLFYGTFLIVISHIVLAQTPPIKFGKIDKSDLTMMVYPLDSSAAAVVLDDFGHIWFDYHDEKGFQMKFTRHARIKVFNEEGYDWANQKALLYKTNDNKEVVRNIKGATYNIVGGKVETSKLERSGIFKEEVNEYWDAEKWTMPNVKSGSIIEFTYTISSDFYFNLRSWNFQYEIPVRRSELVTAIPEYFNFRRLAQGYHGFTKNETTQTGKGVSYSKQKTSASDNRLGMKKTNMELVNLNYNEEINVLVSENVPALKQERYMRPAKNYITKIDFELQSTAFPNTLPKDYRGSWEAMNRSLLNNQFFGLQLNKVGFLKTELFDLIEKRPTKLEKINAIYDLVRFRMIWDDLGGKYVDQSLRVSYQEGKGNSAEINLLLTGLLRSAQFEANPVLLSTRDNGIVREDFPISKQFNYVVTAVKLEDSWLLLDATERSLPIGVLPERCLNGNGRMISEFGGDWISLTPKTKYNQNIQVEMVLSKEMDFSGNIEIVSSGYAGISKRRKYKLESESSYLDQSIAAKSDWVIRKKNFANTTDVKKPFREKYEIKIENHLEEVGNIFLIDPVLLFKEEENPFKAESRNFPIDFTYPISRNYMFILEVPDNMTIEEYPENFSVSLPDKKGRFLYSTTVIGNQIKIISLFSINTDLFLPMEYPYIKEYFSQIVAKQAEKIVLKKKT